jgi:hypothetical protein
VRGALIVLMLVAACAETPDTPPVVRRRPPGPDVRLPLLPSGGPGPAVGAPGVLEVDGVCLYLRAQDGTRTLPVFATASTRWDRATGTLEAAGKRFKPGDKVLLGGGPIATVPAGVTVDPSCRADRMFIAYGIDYERADVRVPIARVRGKRTSLAVVDTLYAEGPCLYLARPPNATLLVFRASGTTWNREEEMLEFGGKSFRPLMPVHVTGTPAHLLTSKPIWAQDPDVRCDASRMFIVDAMEGVQFQGH